MMNCPHTPAGACSFCYEGLQQNITSLNEKLGKRISDHVELVRQNSELREALKELVKASDGTSAEIEEALVLAKEALAYIDGEQGGK